MTSNTPPPPGDPNDPNLSGSSDLPSYGSTPPPPGGDAGGYPPPAPGGYGGGEPETNKKALWSMIVGIVSLVIGLCCGFIALGGIASIILGVIARKEIAASGGTQKGNGMAIAGIATGAVALVILVLVIILYASGVLDYSFTSTDFN